MSTETPHQHPSEGSLHMDVLAKNLKNDPFETHNMDAIRWVLETLKLQHFKVGDWRQVQKTLEALSLVIKENKDVFGTGVHALFFDAAFAYAPHIALTSPSEHAVDLKNRLDALLVQAQQTVANHALIEALLPKDLKTHLEEEIALKKVASDSTQAAPQSRLPSKINWSAGGFGGFAKRVPAVTSVVDEEEMGLGTERSGKSVP